MSTGTLTSIQSGARKLLAKGNRVNVLQVHDGLIYAASSSIEGSIFKVLVLVLHIKAAKLIWVKKCNLLAKVNADRIKLTY